MRSRPPRQIEQEEEDDSSQDVAVEVKDDGPSISSNKKNTFVIIVASIVLIIICYFIFFSGMEEKKPVIEPVIQPVENIATGSAQDIEEVAPSESGKSIFDLAEIDKKEKSENLDLLEKQAKPEIPDIPELPKDVSVDVVDINKIKDSEKNEDKSVPQDVNPANPELTAETPANTTTNAMIPGVNQEELKLKDQKIQELENKIKEFSENSIKEKKLIEEQYLKKEQDLKNSIAQDELLEKQGQEAKKLEEENTIDPRYSPIVVFTGGDRSSPANSVGLEKNIISLSGDEINKIKETKNEVEVEMIKDRTRTIAQGKMLTAILETAINTEFPGAVRGIITRDVYGESGKQVLIPRGSRLYGSYSSQVRRGQARVLISWSRLLRPDGISLNIGLTAADQFGRAGIPGEIDNRYSSLVANSLLTSVLAVAGTAVAQSLMNNGNSQTATTVNATQGTTTTFGNAGNQALYDVTKTIVDIVGTILKNSIDLNPVIRIPQGTRMTVIVNSDIVIPKIRGQ
jgi:type IV secretory pathway VirB10-like protein